ncbi:MAG: carbohydrate porin, partial [Gammaproteobacteria bacterium]|nr:carbohydrate porin [Gammaproteobacteria bacterium]
MDFVKITFGIVPLLAALTGTVALADDNAAPLWTPQLLGAQYTGIRQHLYPFGAAYSGPLSLTPNGDTQTTNTFGAYFGMQMTPRWQAYLDIEMFKGAGIGNATGLGGITDGDAVRAGGGLPKIPYLARAYFQYTLPLDDGNTVPVSRAQDQLPGEQPVSALMVKFGKLSVADDFDQNRYANSTRTQFENWSFINNLAWDYAADTRGYTDGLVLDYARPAWALKFGIYRMPERANHEALEWPITLAHGENLELDLRS